MVWRLLPLVLLCGCGLTPEAWVTLTGGVTIGSIAVIGRTPFDAVYSAATGKDCSVVRLEKGESYCRPVEPAPPPQRYCTRSLAVVDCWVGPAALPRPQAGVADGPSTLTPEQEAHRTRTWPF